MVKSNIAKSVVIFLHGFIIWSLCGAVIGVGMSTTSLNNALIIHAIAAPIIAISISAIYFKKFNYTTALQTAVIFVATAILLDIFIVSILIMKSFEMFESFLGTWLIFILIFIATYLTGKYIRKNN
ncbi:hypothetical protein A3K80_08215 [Candidatus Bathyarchaeota archaeon RBG_13_38_9]|nr:MAG: hypothetical protein A3K80_08215 [Candidatus Bathyarchaeota archaeon RBG_13_38_9]